MKLLQVIGPSSSSWCWWYSLWLSLFITAQAQVAAAPMETDRMAQNVHAVVDWVRSAPNGFVHPALEIRRYNPADLSSPFGMFVGEPLEADDIILQIPRQFLVSSGGQFDQCETVRNLVKEMRRGDASRYAPYMRYLLDQAWGQLPTGWSEGGQDLLNSILRDGRYQVVPPRDPFGYDFREECGETESDYDPFVENAFLLVMQRSWDDLLIPIYDMMSHRNGHWLNTECDDTVHDSNQDIVVRASRDIAAGEEIYTTYNLCSDCSARLTTYGTPEILRDYGFVEQFPQRWIFSKHYDNLAFELDQVAVVNDEDGSVSQDIVLTWLLDDPPSIHDDKIAEFLEDQLERLDDLARAYFQEDWSDVPAHEVAVCRDFLDALTRALVYAREAMSDLERETCRTTPSACDDLYDDLEETFDDSDFSAYLCHDGRTMDFPDHQSLDDTESLYQVIHFFQNPDNRDTCFELDTVVQICGSYRPHYHEMVVSYTAQFVDQVQRVLFVGGGDSMLLHEIVKYPHLELVVGLELDQQVTRGSFRHFGTQPHWDQDGKVEWWYGDAAKSLLMLPKDYFGSFDMVLVDLSETVMSMTVTEGLDIFGALALLLKPEGIIVKNELYLEKFSEIFDYTVQLHFRDVPVICTQSLIFGSYGTDMLYKTPVDHGVTDNLFFKPHDPNGSTSIYDSWHDYRRRTKPTEQNTCRDANYVEPEPAEQIRSPGILVILETEKVTISLTDIPGLKEGLQNAVKQQGFTVLNMYESDPQHYGSILVLVLAEGYVVARTRTEHQYIAFDIHLWSRFDRQNALKHAIVQLVQPRDATSSYRIVAGGMFGMAQWKDDERNRGPRLTRPCPDTDTTERAPNTAHNLLAQALHGAVQNDDHQHYRVLVFCGPDNVACESDTILRQTGGKWVTTIRACSGADCESHVKDRLLAARQQFRAIVLDESVSYEFGQIIHRVFDARTLREVVLGENVVVVANSAQSETWRRVLLDRFRKDYLGLEPVFRAEILFNNSETTTEMGIASSGDSFFFDHILEIAKSLEDETGLVADVRNIQGGMFRYMPQFKPSQFFLPEDYDQTSPLQQWRSQQPLARQTVSQLEVAPLLVKAVRDKVVKIRGQFYKKTIVEKVPSYDDSYQVTQEQIKSAIDHAASTISLSRAVVHESTTGGDGTVTVLIWDEGNAVILWDGRQHVDINFYTTKRKDAEIAETFTNLFVGAIPRLELRLRDEQPRGFGRVVNFAEDLEGRRIPHWASSTKTKHPQMMHTNTR